MLNLSTALQFKPIKEGIIECDCSQPDYFTDDETVERKYWDFLPGKILYRYRDCPYMNRFELLTFKVIKETEASYQFIDGDKPRWVRKDATRSFCYDDKKDAWRNFRKRKDKQLKILRSQVSRIEQVVREIKKIEENPDAKY